MERWIRWYEAPPRIDCKNKLVLAWLTQEVVRSMIGRQIDWWCQWTIGNYSSKWGLYRVLRYPWPHHVHLKCCVGGVVGSGTLHDLIPGALLTACGGGREAGRVCVCLSRQENRPQFEYVFFKLSAERFTYESIWDEFVLIPTRHRALDSPTPHNSLRTSLFFIHSQHHALDINQARVCR